MMNETEIRQQTVEWSDQRRQNKKSVSSNIILEITGETSTVVKMQENLLRWRR